jgi:ABC-2 type transport system permease protein
MRGANAEKPGYREPRRFGAVNWRGLWTLYARDVKRYLKLAVEGVVGPMVSALLFLFVFITAAGDRLQLGLEGVDIAAFIATGLVGYQICLGAFQSAAFPVVYDKLEGMIGDVLSAPVTPLEMVLAAALAATTVALITASAILAAFSLFIDLPLAAPHLIVIFGLLGGLFFAFLGYIAGLWAEKWDRYAAVETFLILPISMLSGTFFAVKTLPELGQRLIEYNPVFYAIDGFRAGFLGPVQSDPATGIVVIVCLDLILALVTWQLVRIGYKIRP